MVALIHFEHFTFQGVTFNNTAHFKHCQKVFFFIIYHSLWTALKWIDTHIIWIQPTNTSHKGYHPIFWSSLEVTVLTFHIAFLVNYPCTVLCNYALIKPRKHSTFSPGHCFLWGVNCELNVDGVHFLNENGSASGLSSYLKRLLHPLIIANGTGRLGERVRFMHSLPVLLLRSHFCCGSTLKIPLYHNLVYFKRLLLICEAWHRFYS